MALARKMLEAMGLTKEQVDSIIEAHTETVDGLKDQLKGLKEKADSADALQRQIDDLKGGTDWKAEHDRVKKQYDDYVAEVAGKEESAAVRQAYRGLLAEEHIDPDMIDTIMQATRFDGMKRARDGALQDRDKLAEGIRSKWQKFVVQSSSNGADVGTPPKGGATARTREEIMSIRDTAERQKAMMENHELFGI